jgi:type I restriction enzyme M protein
VPPRARWEHLLDNAKQPGIGQYLDEAMDLIEYENPNLKGVPRPQAAGAERP